MIQEVLNWTTINITNHNNFEQQRKRKHTMTINQQQLAGPESPTFLLGSENYNHISTNNNNTERERPRGADETTTMSAIGVPAKQKQPCPELKNQTLISDANALNLLSLLSSSLSSSPQLQPQQPQPSLAPPAPAAMMTRNTTTNNPLFSDQAVQRAVWHYQLQQQHQQQVQARRTQQDLLVGAFQLCQQASSEPQQQRHHPAQRCTAFRPLPGPPRLPTPTEAMHVVIQSQQ